jgi:hypothetical protein
MENNDSSIYDIKTYSSELELKHRNALNNHFLDSHKSLK